MSMRAGFEKALLSHCKTPFLFSLRQACPSPARGPNAALDQILTGPCGLIHKTNRIRPTAGIVVKCSPTDIHPTKCGSPAKNFGHTLVYDIICLHPETHLLQVIKGLLTQFTVFC